MRTSVLSLLAVMLAFGTADAQERRVSVAGAEFRAEPDGALLAEVGEGTVVEVAGATRSDWREATLEGWIWGPSVRENERDGHDLSVAVSGAENLRLEPNGRVIARVREGMLLDRIETNGRWIRVRRSAWIPLEALAAERGSGAAADTASATSTDPGRWARVGSRGTPLLGAPDGDTLARAEPATTLRIVSREGNWARVRLEGWVWTPSLASPSDADEVVEDVTPEALAANPGAHEGRLVEWTVEFVALDRAEGLRRDLHAGERFILARAPGDSPGFVYIAVPEDLVDEVRRLPALEEITVLARVRTGRSDVMDAPVLDLLELQ
ncbi:MAG: hypothetical protein ACOC8B_07450 [Gemmatimonadota bacterium]